MTRNFVQKIFESSSLKKKYPLTWWFSFNSTFGREISLLNFADEIFLWLAKPRSSSYLPAFLRPNRIYRKIRNRIHNRDSGEVIGLLSYKFISDNFGPWTENMNSDSVFLSSEIIFAFLFRKSSQTFSRCSKSCNFFAENNRLFSRISLRCCNFWNTITEVAESKQTHWTPD